MNETDGETQANLFDFSPMLGPGWDEYFLARISDYNHSAVRDFLEEDLDRVRYLAGSWFDHAQHHEPEPGYPGIKEISYAFHQLNRAMRLWAVHREMDSRPLLILQEKISAFENSHDDTDRPTREQMRQCWREAMYLSNQIFEDAMLKLTQAPTAPDVATTAPAAADADYLFHNEGATWRIIYQGGEERTVNHSIGMTYIQALLQRPGEWLGALQLESAGGVNPDVIEDARNDFEQEGLTPDADAVRKASGRVRTNLNRAVRRISQKCPALATHLHGTITKRDYACQYLTDSPPAWKF